MSMDQRDPFEYDTEKRGATSPGASQGSSEDSDTSDDDIIELTDLIKKGKGIEDSPSDFEFEQESEQTEEAGKSILDSNDDNLDEIIAGLETELEMNDTETGDRDTEKPAPSARADNDTSVGARVQMEETRPAPEDLEETPTISLEAVEEVEEKHTSHQVLDDAPRISQERIEAILIPVIKDVVERTVRETVAEVSERVIKEAIDSLKDSLAPPGE